MADRQYSLAEILRQAANQLDPTDPWHTDDEEEIKALAGNLRHAGTSIYMLRENPYLLGQFLRSIGVELKSVGLNCERLGEALFHEIHNQSAGTIFEREIAGPSWAAAHPDLRQILIHSAAAIRALTLCDQENEHLARIQRREKEDAEAVVDRGTAGYGDCQFGVRQAGPGDPSNVETVPWCFTHGRHPDECTWRADIDARLHRLESFVMDPLRRENHAGDREAAPGGRDRAEETKGGKAQETEEGT